MKSKTIIILIALLSLSSISCKRVAMKFLGIHLPTTESRQSIQDFLLKAGQDTANTFALDSALFVEMQHAPYKPGWDSGFRPFQIRVYDNTGQPVMQWASCEGFLKDLKTFDSVPPKNFNGLNRDFTLAEDLNQYWTLSGEKVEVDIPEGVDYYVVIYFANWYPRMSRKIFQNVQKYTEQHPELKFQVYKVCVDIMEFWDIETVVTLY
ncbi:MAG: hypothetical protein IH596_01045 [Bacteroidales bacterium]|nr:hypothetical protein [Bacteroidales bacterium]